MNTAINKDTEKHHLMYQQRQYKEHTMTDSHFPITTVDEGLPVSYMF